MSDKVVNNEPVELQLTIDKDDLIADVLKLVSLLRPHWDMNKVTCQVLCAASHYVNNVNH